MRTLPLRETDAIEGIEGDDPTVRFLDWKDSPSQVLEMVDDLLKAHGLEVVTFETGADDHLFKIEKRA